MLPLFPQLQARTPHNYAAMAKLLWAQTPQAKTPYYYYEYEDLYVFRLREVNNT